MTIYTTLRASDYPNGTLLSSISGWTGTPGNFSVSNGGWSGGGTALYNTGAAVVRGFADVADGVIVVPLSVAGASYPNIYFLQFGVQSGGGHLLTFYDNNGSYSSNVRFLPGSGVPDSPRIGWVIAGNQITVTINGRAVASYLNAGQATDLASGWPTGSGGTYLDAKTIPPAYVGGTYGGWLSLGGGNPPYIQLRNNADILLIDSVALQRANATQQKAFVTFESSVTGATHVGISVLSPSGTVLIAEQSVAISAGSYTTAAIPSTAENGNIVIHARTLDGTASDQTDFTIFLPRTIVAKPCLYAQNMTPPVYYSPTSMFRDLTKTFIWKYNNLIPIPDWADTIPDGRIHATDGGFSANLLPISFKGNTSIKADFSYQLDPDWVGVPTTLTLPPGMDFSLYDPNVTILKNLSTGVHTVTFGNAICNGRSLSIVQNSALSGSSTQPYGLPTTDWINQFSWRLASDVHPELYVNDSYAQWWGKSGLSGIRMMKVSNAEESGFARGAVVPSTRWTDAHRAKVTDAMWTITYLGDMPVQVLVELCNRAQKNLHYAFPRGCTESYIRGFTDYVRDHLASGLKFLVERSNEVWNSSYSCYQGYAYDGFQAGLGKPAAVYGANNGSYFPGRDTGSNGFPGSYIPHNSAYDPVWAPLKGSQADPYPPQAYAVNAYATSVDSSIYICTAAAPAPTSLYTGTIPDKATYVDVNQYYSALATYLQNRANFYRANVEPQIDTAHWAQFQNYAHARQRAHVTEHQQMVAWVKDEMGAQASRVQSVVNVFNLDVAADGNQTLENYLVWASAANTDGTLNSAVDHFTTGAYFLNFKYDYSTAPNSVKNAAAGSARQNAMIADILANDVPQIRTLHTTNAQALLNFAQSGNSKSKALSPQPALGVYEGGTNWQFVNWPDASSQAYHDDVLAVTYSRMGEMIGPLYAQLGDDEGGLLTAFNDFYPETLFNTYPSTQNGLVWGFSDGVGDITSSAFTALRDVSVARGGSVVDASSSSGGTGGGGSGGGSTSAFSCVVTTQFYRR